jgi:hypothetical protein
VACAGEPEPISLRPAPVVPGSTPIPAPSAAPAGKDATKGDSSDAEWVPAEHKSGAARWKDTGVYLDGKPIGFLTWGELPLALKPVWLRDKVSANKRAGTDDPGWRWMQQRFYRFTDYLIAMGVDLKRVKEVHVYGPRFSNSIVATRDDLLSPVARDFLFHFGGSVYGKAIPRTPERFALGNPPDKISGVMIYVDKAPPKYIRGVGFELDGHPQENVPYFGDPVRGGVRVYLDDRLAAVIKRQELDPKAAKPAPDGELRWSFAATLAAQGVDLAKVVELHVIRNERRAETIPRQQLAELTFEASAQARGGLLLGEERYRANAIALHTRAIAPSELPYVTPDDE